MTQQEGDVRRRRDEAEENFRDSSLRLQTEKLEFERRKDEALVFKLKQYGDAIRNSVSKMSDNSPIDFLPFIANFERLFESLAVPADIRVSLISPYLSDRCRNLINRLQGEEATSYEFVKKYLMDQLRLVPSYFVDQFNHVVKYQTETYKSFASRLTTLLKYYVESRHVDDFDSLLQLLICDRIKSTLPEGALNHVVRTEANLPEQWCRKDSLCDTLDTYYAVYDKFDKPKASALSAHIAPQQNRFQMGRGNGENRVIFTLFRDLQS